MPVPRVEEEEANWRLDASCKEWPTSWWFDEEYEEQALEICRECLVQEECASSGENEEYGIWAGRWMPFKALHHPGSQPKKPDKPAAGYQGCGKDHRCGWVAGYRAGGRCKECLLAGKFSSRVTSLRFRDAYNGCKIDAKCGTKLGYKAGGRCSSCRAAGRAAGATPRPLAQPPPSYKGCDLDDRCGTNGGYKAGGRCVYCLSAKRLTELRVVENSVR